VRISSDCVNQIPGEYVEVARSESDGDLDAASDRLNVEGIRHFSIMTLHLTKDPSPRHVYRILVPPDSVAEAREIISLVKSGAFELRDDELPPQ
jgi:hypothetical protein